MNDLPFIPATMEQRLALIAWKAQIEKAALEQWEPLNTAPTDGTCYIACDGFELWQQNKPPGCAAGHWTEIDGEWRGSAIFGAKWWRPMLSMPAAIRAQEQK